MRIIFLLGGLFIALPIGVFVVWSVLADASMLVDAGGVWMLGLYLVVPALMLLSAAPAYIRRNAWRYSRRRPVR